MTDLEMLLHLMNKADVTIEVTKNELIEYQDFNTGEEWQKTYPTVVRIYCPLLTFDEQGKLIHD